MHLFEQPLFDVPVPPQRKFCFRCSPQPLAPPDGAAYGYLLGLYLGDGCVSSLKRGVYSLRIFCAEQWPGLIEACREAMQAVRPYNRVGGVSKDGCVAVTSLSKHWPCLLPQHGPGPKHTRPIELLPWQQDIVEAHNQMFLRGLFHSDGYRGENRVRRPLRDGDRWYSYARYLFNNRSVDILGLCGEALDREGVEWRYNRPDSISVARRASVALMDTFIGPKY